MRLGLILSCLILSTSILAENITCTLQSGVEKSSVTFDFKDMEDDYIYAWNEEGVYDLNFSLEGECMGNTCDVYMTIDSQMLEDEVGQVGFEFLRIDRNFGRIFGEELTNAPDGRDYVLYCYYNQW